MRSGQSKWRKFYSANRFYVDWGDLIQVGSLERNKKKQGQEGKKKIRCVRGDFGFFFLKIKHPLLRDMSMGGWDKKTQTTLPNNLHGVISHLRFHLVSHGLSECLAAETKKAVLKKIVCLQKKTQYRAEPITFPLDLT